MTRKGSADVGFLLFGGYDVRGETTDLEWDKEAVTEDTTVLGVADASHAAVGLKRGMLTQKGFFNDAANSIHDHLVGLANRVATFGHEGNTIGMKFAGWAGAITVKYRRIAARGAFHKAEGDYQVTGVVEDGKVSHDYKTESTASGSTASVDNAASSANGGAGYLEVSGLNLGGYTSLTLKERHSTDNAVFTDLITFAAVTASFIAERKTVAGTVNRYTRAEWTFNGAGAGQTVDYMQGFVRN